jgi:hypothetical protein
VKPGALVPGISATIIAVGVAVACGYLLPYVGYKLLYLAFSAGHPGDPSIGDSVGWMIVFVWPAALLAVIAASVTAGIVAFLIAYRRLAPPAVPLDDDLRG